MQENVRSDANAYVSTISEIWNCLSGRPFLEMHDANVRAKVGPALSFHSMCASTDLVKSLIVVCRLLSWAMWWLGLAKNVEHSNGALTRSSAAVAFRCQHPW